MANVNVELAEVDIVSPTVQILLGCKEKGENLIKLKTPSIYMVPGVFRDLSPSSFTPKVVAIGPLHRQDKDLERFEDQKAIHLHDLLSLVKVSPQETLEVCVQKVCRSIHQIKACYVDMGSCNDADLAEMMVIDGCFILDFLYRLSKGNGIIKNMLITQSIIYDLLLIENQIPFLVLKDIFDCTVLIFEPTASLTKLMKGLLRRYNIFGANLVIGDVGLDSAPGHILGLLHKSFQPFDDKSSKIKEIPKGHSAVELDRAGVNFRPREDKDWPMAIKLALPTFSCFPWFWCKPTLRMPVLCIDDFTDLVLRNLIIYEQSSPVPNYVTSYACAMDMLIDTPEDVAMLVKSEVLINDLGSDEKAAEMINNICREVPIVDFFYYQEWQKLDFYYNEYWPNVVAGLKRRYFNNPWNIIAVFAGFVLFALTVVQTIFTINPR